MSIPLAILALAANNMDLVSNCLKRFKKVRTKYTKKCLDLFFNISLHRRLTPKRTLSLMRIQTRNPTRSLIRSLIRNQTRNLIRNLTQSRMWTRKMTRSSECFFSMSTFIWRLALFIAGSLFDGLPFASGDIALHDGRCREFANGQSARE